jgi:hypothetical protein
MNGPRKFGKHPPKTDARTLRIEKYFTAKLAPPPLRADWTRGFRIDYGTMLNDTLGDCTEAKKGHAIQCWTLCNGRMVTVPDDAVLAAYEADAGYVPGDPATDQGENMLDNLNAWRKNGFGGHALMAYAAINYSSFWSIAQSISLFGLVDIGFQIPQSALDQNAAGKPWDVVADDGGIQGGHDVIVPAYDLPSQTLTCITWGERQQMTWAFFQKYVDEAYALLSPNWISTRGVDPAGVDLETLVKDLVAVTKS